MKNETQKIGFFKRIKISIFNPEDYKLFASEKLSKALKYFFIIILITTIVSTIVSTEQVTKEVHKLISYVKNEFPDFSYADDTLNVSEFINAYDEEYEARLIVDTSDDVDDEKLTTYQKEVRDSLYSAILLKDKVIYTVPGYQYESNYKDLMSSFGLNEFNKNDIVDKYFDSNGLTKINVVIGIYAFLTTFIMNFLTFIEDMLIVALFGWLAAKISGIALKFSQAVSLSSHSLTLSIILMTVYYVVRTYMGFEVKYFAIMYMLIAYIYMIAAIMIIKSDLNRTGAETVTVEGQVVKDEDIIEGLDDLDDKEDDKKENKDSNDNENPIDIKK